MTHSQNKMTTNSMAIIAIIAVLALLAVVPITIFIIQEAEARGCRTSQAANASKGRCVNPGP